jgi:hypothetical protein
LTLASGGALAERLGGDEEKSIYLADRSTLRIHPGSALEVLENSGSSMAFALRQGRVEFDIMPGGPRMWKIACGDVSVEVLGTSFVLERSPISLHVSVSRGAVLVKGVRVEDGVQKLVPGQSLVVSLSRPDPAVVPGDIDDIVSTAPRKLDAALTPEPAPQKEQERSVRGRNDDADETSKTGGDTVSITSAQRVTDLFALADAARLAGHTKEAAAPLMRIVDTYPEDSRAGLAAFTLGKLYLEQLSRFKEAAEAFAKAESLGLPASLREAASANQVKALSNAEDPRAAEVGKRYLDLYPSGRYRERVERWMEK